MSVRLWLLALRGPLLLWLVASLLVLGATVFQHMHLTAIRQQSVQLRHQLAGQQATLEHARLDAQTYAFYQQHAKHWLDIGLRTPSDADSWRQTMYRLQQSSALPHVRYILQRTVNDAQQWPGTTPPALLPLQVTPVEMFLSTTHEDDALQWLQQLQARYAEALMVRMCEWTLSEKQHTIEAHCLLHWMHLPFTFPAGQMTDDEM